MEHKKSAEILNVPAIGAGQSFERWLGEGLFSGTAAGTVSALTDILYFLSFIVCYSWGFINTDLRCHSPASAEKSAAGGL